ncbi:PKD domain-containing protein [Candidatus Peregrinibacteria bacterium]|nr:MAG: PKD domain-containing protein [Candidatus Peregrinibacteria bacterium]
MDVTPNPIPENNPNLEMKPSPEPVPNAPSPLQNPAPLQNSASLPNPAPKKTLTPEEKKVQRQATLKRLATVSVALYVFLLLLIFAWGTFTAGVELTVFDYLPLSQNTFSGALMTLFHILLGASVFILFFYSLVALLKSMFTKKEEVEKKKKASRKALLGGLTFLLFAAAWLAGIWYLGPRLVLTDLYESPIKTIPTQTLGLTSPVEIRFDASGIPVDTKLYRILSYTWDFGDGATANGVSTAHTYTQKATGNGIYTVLLSVRYADLSTGEQFEDTFKTTVAIANEKTAAYFTANPEAGELPLKVHFDATSSYDPDGEIVAYEWDFDNDGSFDDGEGEEIDHTFTQEGDYLVSLRVTDNSGEYNTASLTIEAGSIGGLRAVITTNVAEGEAYYLDEEYKFDGSLSQIGEGKITQYSWDFGDGSVAVKTRSVNHRFEAVGVYTVVLTVTDPEGNSDESTLEVRVVEEGSAPEAKISTLPALENRAVTGPVPLEVRFDATASFDEENDIVDYEWDFDNDGTVDDTGDTATHTYQVEGSFEARLITTDSVGNVDEALVPIEVTAQGLIARLEIDQSNGEVPLTVEFDASASTYKEGNIVSYEYDFGDGSDSYIGGSSVTYRYNAVGTFTASVTVIASDGKRGSTSVQIVVRPVALTACFTVNTDSGQAPLFVSVDPSCSEGTVDSYHWDFGDGEISFDRKPETHTYSTPGTYTITLEVTSAEGIVSVFENEITVR